MLRSPGTGLPTSALPRMRAPIVVLTFGCTSDWTSGDCTIGWPIGSFCTVGLGAGLGCGRAVGFDVDALPAIICCECGGVACGESCAC